MNKTRNYVSGEQVMMRGKRPKGKNHKEIIYVSESGEEKYSDDASYKLPIIHFHHTKVKTYLRLIKNVGIFYHLKLLKSSNMIFHVF